MRELLFISACLEGVTDMKDEEKTKEQLIRELKMLRWMVENTKNLEAERTALEEALREKEEKLQIIFNAHPESIIMTNVEGIVLAANEACAATFGKDIEELVGSSLYDLFPPEVAEKRRSRIEEAVFTGRQVHYEDVFQQKHYDNCVYPAFDDKGLVSKIVICSTDITERTNLEKALETAEWKYRHTYEIVTEGIFQIAPDGQFISANNALARIYGYASPEDLLHSVTDITSQHYVDPARRSAFIRLLKEEGAVYNFEAQMYQKERNMIWVSINVRAVRDKRRRKILYYEGAVEDITKRKRLEAQLVQSQRTEAIGKLTGGIAYNFNNLLTAVMGNFELLLHKLQPSDIESREVRAIQETIGEALKLCEQLLPLSRRQLIRPVDTNINHVVMKMERMLKYLVGEDVAYAISVDPDIKTIKVDPSLIEQVILILAVNAREAMPKGGRLRIVTENLYYDTEQCPIGTGTGPGEYVMLTVSDTGTGILPAILEHIFEPFFTIKPDGTGLGLSIVHSIVKQSGGNISVDSREGQGTTFRIYFPVLPFEERAEEDTLLRLGESTLPTKATVLVVEDESGILYWVTDVLEGLGHTVLPAFSAEEAISAVEKYEGAVDLLITDMVMPGKQGQELAEILKIRYPHMKVIFMSGYGDGRIPDADTPAQKASFLSKPFTPLLLLMKVKEALGS